jgi:hypothetical protein
MRDAETEAFIEPQGGVDFHNAQTHRLVETFRLADEPIHHLATDTPPLKGSVHKELPNKKTILSRCTL